MASGIPLLMSCKPLWSHLTRSSHYNREVLRRGICLLIVLFSAITVSTAQIDRYDRKFLIQLRGDHGRVREYDLDRVFDLSQPTQCYGLVDDEGEWPTGLFFNEKRDLRD